MSKEQQLSLKIYIFRNPMESTEWASLMGSKYQTSLPFPFSFVDTPSEANVIVWDGQISEKLSHRLDGIEKMIAGKILIMNSIYESKIQTQQEPLWLRGLFNRPEELLEILVNAYQRLSYV